MNNSQNSRFCQAVEKILNFKDLTYAQSVKAIKVVWGRIANEDPDERWILEQLAFEENHNAIRLRMANARSTNWRIVAINKSGMVTLSY